MVSYLEIKKFDKCSKQEWNAFCDNSDDVWLWHHYDSIVAKSLWSNLENNSRRKKKRVRGYLRSKRK